MWWLLQPISYLFQGLQLLLSPLVTLILKIKGVVSLINRLQTQGAWDSFLIRAAEQHLNMSFLWAKVANVGPVAILPVWIPKRKFSGYPTVGLLTENPLWLLCGLAHTGPIVVLRGQPIIVLPIENLYSDPK